MLWWIINNMYFLSFLVLFANHRVFKFRVAKLDVQLLYFSRSISCSFLLSKSCMRAQSSKKRDNFTKLVYLFCVRLLGICRLITSGIQQRICRLITSGIHQKQLNCTRFSPDEGSAFHLILQIWFSRCSKVSMNSFACLNIDFLCNIASDWYTNIFEPFAL